MYFVDKQMHFLLCLRLYLPPHLPNKVFNLKAHLLPEIFHDQFLSLEVLLQLAVHAVKLESQPPNLVVVVIAEEVVVHFVEGLLVGDLLWFGELDRLDLDAVAFEVAVRL